jgi:hypothetical protein
MCIFRERFHCICGQSESEFCMVAITYSGGEPNVHSLPTAMLYPRLIHFQYNTLSVMEKEKIPMPCVHIFCVYVVKLYVFDFSLLALHFAFGTGQRGVYV